MNSLVKSENLFILFIFFSISAFAYPDFISYGYNSCLNCHYNGMGGGPLTDYGRSLFATEITARTFVSNKTHTKVEIERIGITFPKSVFIDGLYLEDLTTDTLLLFLRHKVK